MPHETNEPIPPRPGPITQVRLALSGGGFRATLYHLGVVGCLYDAKLLDKVKLICSVSGGSILAGHLVANWLAYTGQPADFYNVVKELLSFVQSDLRGFIVRRAVNSLFRGNAIPNRFLATEYRSFYGETVTWQDLEATCPRLHILATSLTTGSRCSFSQEGFWPNPMQGSVPFLAATTGRPIADAVSASSAFPPVFAPFELNAKDLGAAFHDQVLTDGGVYDNLGIEHLYFLNNNQPIPESTLVLISDAGQEFELAPSQQFPSLLDLASRTTDIMMARLSDTDIRSTVDKLKDVKGRPPLVVRMSTTFAPPAGDLLSYPVQNKLAKIRTDLDAFSDAEVYALYRHGYECAAAALASESVPFVGQAYERGKEWLPVKLGEEIANAAALEKCINESDKREGFRSLWSSEDVTGSVIGTANTAKYPALIGCLFFAALIAVSIGTLIAERYIVKHEPPAASGSPKMQRVTTDLTLFPWTVSNSVVRSAFTSRLDQGKLHACIAETESLGAISDEAPYGTTLCTVSLGANDERLEHLTVVVARVHGGKSDYEVLGRISSNRFVLPSGGPDDRLFIMTGSKDIVDPSAFSDRIHVQMEEQ